MYTQTFKVGSRQHADDSSASKKQRKIAKAAATTSGTLGLRVCGMQVRRPSCHVVLRTSLFYSMILHILHIFRGAMEPPPFQCTV